MPDKQMSIERARPNTPTIRPFTLAIAGDSAAGKTTLAGGLVEALGADRSTSICTDDYHRYDRTERKDKPFTALHPSCNYVQIIEQHLQLIATGQPILKPVYNHETGTLDRPQLVEPKEFVIVEGLLPLHTKLMRSCFDVTVYLDPPEDVRRGWKLSRDTGDRGYTKEQVLAELARREPESEEFIRAQRASADIVLQFAPVAGREDPPNTPLSATLLLRPTVPHPPLVRIVEDTTAIHIKMMRDDDPPGRCAARARLRPPGGDRPGGETHLGPHRARTGNATGFGGPRAGQAQRPFGREPAHPVEPPPFDPELTSQVVVGRPGIEAHGLSTPADHLPGGGDL